MLRCLRLCNPAQCHVHLGYTCEAQVRHRRPTLPEVHDVVRDLGVQKNVLAPLVDLLSRAGRWVRVEATLRGLVRAARGSTGDSQGDGHRLVTQLPSSPRSTSGSAACRPGWRGGRRPSSDGCLRMATCRRVSSSKAVRAGQGQAQLALLARHGDARSPLGAMTMAMLSSSMDW